MGRKQMRDRLETLGQALAAHGVLFPTPPASKGKLLSGLAEYLKIRDAWETGGTESLPSIDVEGTVLTLEQLAVVATQADFAVRRATDGLEASRPVAVDALRISELLAACLSDLRPNAPHDWETTPRKLRLYADLLCGAQFELSRTLVDYLITHFAPNVEAGRDEPDAWLTLDETNEVRLGLLRRVVDTQRAMAHLGSTAPDLLADTYANRIIAIAQVGSLRDPNQSLADRVRELGWLLEHEAVEARALIGQQLSLKCDDNGRFLIASAILESVEQGLGSPEVAFREASNLPGLRGRNLVGVLRTVLGFVSCPAEAVSLITRILDEAAEIGGSEGAGLRTESLPQMLQACATYAASDPDSIRAVLRRIAFISADSEPRGEHLWLVPGSPAVAVLERPGSTEVIPLPGLSDITLFERLINEHAEEFEAIHSVDGLRRAMTQAIEPLRSPLCACHGPVTVHAFGHLKHIPLASLAGRGSILACAPGVRIFAPGSEPIGPKAARRLWVVDDSLSQVTRLPITGNCHVAAFNSASAELDRRAIDAFATLQAAEMNEFFYFGHGHVDQFRVELAGLVLHQSTHGPKIVPSIQVARFDLRHVELAVVLACGAGQGNVFVEPSLSIGHAFRVAGVQYVIAPQWPVKAQDALAFVERFLHHLGQGQDYVGAWSKVLAEDPNRYMSIAMLGS